MAGDTRIVRIVVNARDALTGSKKTEDAMERIRREAARTGTQVERLTSTLKGFAITAVGGMGFAEMFRGVNTIQNAENALRTITSSQEELNAAWDTAVGIARETRADLESTITLYTRLTRATETFGISSEASALITSRVNKALASSGATASEAASVVTQLSQAFQSGQLMGEEFNAMAENAPEILNAVSAATGIARENLKKAASEGKIGIADLVRALTTYGGKIDETFAQTAPTIEQSLQVMKTNAMDAGRQFEAMTGTFAAIATAIGWLAQNLDIVAVAMSGVAVLAIPKLIAGIKALTVATATNPIGLLAVAVSAAAVAIYTNWEPIQNFLHKSLTLTIPVALREAHIGFLQFGEKLGDVFSTIARFIGGIVNKILEYLGTMLNGAIGGINTLTEGLNTVPGLLEKIGIEVGRISAIPEVKIPGVEWGDGGAQGPSLAEARIQSIRGEVVALTEAYKPLNETVAQTAVATGSQTDALANLEAQLAALAAKSKTTDGTKGGGGSKKSPVEKLREQVDRLRGGLDETVEAQQKFEAAQKTINAALDAGIISQAEATDLLAKARKEMEAVGQQADGTADKLEKIKEANQSFRDSFSDAFESAILKGQDLQSVLSDLAGQIASIFYQRSAGSFINTVLDGISLFSAKGNVFSRGAQVQAFAKGGVVGGPTVFPMSGGKTGMMGEAGPEAIMPLTRDANGRLGVRTSGGGGTSVTIAPVISVNANGGTPAQNEDLAQRTSAQIVPALRGLVQAELHRAMRPGGLINNTRTKLAR